MVFFTCSSCGESLKKAQVDKHKATCRGCTCLSCIDCGKDFWGEDYRSHVRCVSEEQKYGGRDYEAKANKGEVKQQEWLQRIQDAMTKPGISPKLKEVLIQVRSYENVPRKKAKFQNWMKNSLRIYDQRLHDQVWQIFSAADSNPVQQPNGTQHLQPETDPAPPPQLQQPQEEEKPREKKKNKRERKEERQKKSKRKQEKNGGVEQEQNGGTTSDERQKKKKRKRAAEECEEEGQSADKPKKRKEEEPEEKQSLEDTKDQQEVQDQPDTRGKFNWKGTIKAVLRQAPDEGLAVKKLRKKVLAAYYSFSGDGNYKSEEELFSLFNKKISSPKFKVVKDKVRLVK